MCGIFFSSGRESDHPVSDNTLEYLCRRGPDQIDRVVVNDQNVCCSFFSSVLALRGDSLVAQPLQDPQTDSILCWNGEAWKIDDTLIAGNDAQKIFDNLLRAGPKNPYQALDERERLDDAIVRFFSRVSGPFAFIFYNARQGSVYYGRDRLGRRSLLRTKAHNGNIVISSVCIGPSTKNWAEVEADGVYVIHLANISENTGLVEKRIAWPETKDLHESLSFRSCNRPPPCLEIPRLSLATPAVDELLMNLRRALAIRAVGIPGPPAQTSTPTKVAILFSGGLDCTLLTRIIHDLLPQDQDIDLLNVAFENPRVLKATAARNSARVPPYSLCPDRVTGLSTYAELQQVCPGRTWRFVSIDVSYMETVSHRSQVTTLIHPHNTEMDLSIARALYFAARGVGTIRSESSDDSRLYSSPARVLISGLGADELFGGYTRHATAFSRMGFQGLSDELELDYGRLGKRNLGRDDRVISHWGREVRYPYLDEDFLRWALRLPLWEKCGFGQCPGSMPVPSKNTDDPLLEPSKKLLRLLSWKLGMKSAATEKKRAIQFGARSAKMEVGRTKGTQVLP
ncbi:MAG: hypothetical protein Q9197_001259 [Variospora fuerteventurae]